jgi:hypothetical protein
LGGCVSAAGTCEITRPSWPSLSTCSTTGANPSERSARSASACGLPTSDGTLGGCSSGRITKAPMPRATAPNPPSSSAADGALRRGDSSRTVPSHASAATSPAASVTVTVTFAVRLPSMVTRRGTWSRVSVGAAS